MRVANYSNKVEPFVTFINVDNFFYLDIGSKSIFTTYFKENFIYDDDSDLFESSVIHSYADIDKEIFVTGTRLSATTHCTEVQIDSGQCEPYVDLVMRSSFDKTIIQRRYEKFFSSVSEVGGFADLIIYCLWVVYFFVNQWRYQKLVRSQLINHFLMLNREGGIDMALTNTPEITKYIKQANSSRRRAKKMNHKKEVQTLNYLFDNQVQLERLIQINSQAKISLIIFNNHHQTIFDTITPQILLQNKLKTKSEKSQIISSILQRKFGAQETFGNQKSLKQIFPRMSGNLQLKTKCADKTTKITPQIPGKDLNIESDLLGPDLPSFSKSYTKHPTNLQDRLIVKKRVRIPINKIRRPKIQEKARQNSTLPNTQSANKKLRLTLSKRLVDQKIQVQRKNGTKIQLGGSTERVFFF